MARRIERYPRYCCGAFSKDSGEALGSLFVMPVCKERLLAAGTWAETANLEVEPPADTPSLFGISLTSADWHAVDALIKFFLPLALEDGRQEVYLGSPLPGLRAWRRRNPDVPIDDYVFAKRDGRPIDPQLYYYQEKGFTTIEAAKPNYFPHERSLDYGAIIRADLSVMAAALGVA
jgi:hypothetical protein